jgi:hypothetical protein
LSYEADRNDVFSQQLESFVKENDKIVKVYSELAAIMPSVKPNSASFKKLEDYKQIEAKIKEGKAQIDRVQRKLSECTSTAKIKLESDKEINLRGGSEELDRLKEECLRK